MFEFGEQATDLYPIGAGVLATWAPAAVAAIFIAAGALLAASGRVRIHRAVPLGLALVLALAGGWVLGAWALNYFDARSFAAERQSLDARAFELKMPALMPGSPLACLEPTASETVLDACDKGLFASPEATAAAVSYVSAQLSLLTAARQHAKGSGVSYSKLLTAMRRVVEADRFGIVAHLFARAGCSANQCALFALLQDASRVKVNLAERPFEKRVETRAAEWSSVANRSIASASSPALPAVASAASAAAAPAKAPSKLFFPSSASIPAVNIIASEPPAAQPAQEATASADTSTRSSKPVQETPSRRQASAVDGARSGPLRIVPPAQ
jgi:hypothetical protein